MAMKTQQPMKAKKATKATTRPKQTKTATKQATKMPTKQAPMKKAAKNDANKPEMQAPVMQQQGQQESMPAVPAPHASHYKTWFFTGRTGYVLTSLQIDIANGADHETWMRA